MPDTLPKPTQVSPCHSQMQPYIVKTWGKGQPHQQKRVLQNNWFASVTGKEQGAHPGWDLMAFHSPLYLLGCNLHCAQSGECHIIFTFHLCEVSEVLRGVRGQLCRESRLDSRTLSCHRAWGWQRPRLLLRRRLSRRSLSGCWISLPWHSTTDSTWEQQDWSPVALLDPSDLDSN